jgi:thiamine biosynthesis lipoprotein
VDEETWCLLEAALELWHATGGAFDTGLGAEMDALGFRGRPAVASEVSVAPRPPFELDAGARTIRMTRPGALLDLGGVAKGFALDLAASELREAGIGCALLHGGTSSVLALGAPPQAGEAGSGNALPGWRVAIEVSPGPADSECLLARLVDASLSVSAPRGRTSSAGGHVLDPRCGRPAARVRTACVVAASGLVADALATALVAAAPSGRELFLPPRTAAALARPGAPGWTRMGASEGVFENGGPVSPHRR